MNLLGNESPGASLSLKARLIEVTAALVNLPREPRFPTMREIASDAGVTPGAAYRHFASQDELLLAVVRYLFDDLERALRGATATAADSRSAVVGIANAYVEWGMANPGGYQLLFETTDRESVFESDERPGLHLIVVVAQHMAGDGRPSDHDIDRATRLWVSLHGLVALRLHKTGMRWTHTLEHDVREMVVAVLRA